MLGANTSILRWSIPQAGLHVGSARSADYTSPNTQPNGSSQLTTKLGDMDDPEQPEWLNRIMSATQPTTEQVRPSDGFSISVEKLNILRHSIGYDDNGGDRFPNARSMDERRNHFVTHPDARDWNLCKELVAMGYMAEHGPRKIIGGDYLFTVTDEGREVVLLHKPVRQKLTASQRRYQDFLDADSGLTFKEWLKCKRERC